MAARRQPKTTSPRRAPSPDKEDIEEYKEVFGLFDRDGDGYIDSTELGTCMRALGRNPTQEDLERIAMERLAQGKTQIDFADFLTLMVQNDPSSPDEESEILDAFQVFDQTGSGTISVAELRHVMSTLGEKLTEDEMDEMMREFNILSDGTIDYREFIRNLIRS